jgi:transcriptional regulator with XRE-family HTH domain
MPTRRTAAKPGGSTWPLGDYLREQRGKMSIREAARRADISESRWRQVELGYQTMGGGIKVPVQPRAETLAQMCKAIAGDVRRGLELGGYNPDQYTWLLETEATERLADDDRVDWFATLPREEREAVLAELQRAHVDAEVSNAAGTRRGRKATG